LLLLLLLLLVLIMQNYKYKLVSMALTESKLIGLIELAQWFSTFFIFRHTICFGEAWRHT
jgi:hypothetical protein